VTTPASHAGRDAARDAPGVIAPPPLIFLAALAGGFVLDAVLPDASLPDVVQTVAGIALIVAGSALAASFVRQFRRVRTPVNPGEATTAIVTGGPYRLTRNPGYLGMALAFAGIVIVAGALWGLIALVPALIVVDRGVIAREERYLERKFGEEYLRYKARVRRWL
jgi:protein-S-isoprenylcysteine O-methyltransferase Ste14